MSHACSRHEHVQNIYTDMTECRKTTTLIDIYMTNYLSQITLKLLTMYGNNNAQGEHKVTSVNV
jgi:hypothetical protein